MKPSDDEKGSKGAGTGKAKATATESLKKMLVSGIEAALTTEDGIRNTLGELKLPKEVINSLLTQTEKGRREISRLVTDELHGVLSGLDLQGEIRKALVGLRLEVNASVRILDDGVEASVSAVNTCASEEDADEACYTDKHRSDPG